jgi:hypothetical protein
VLTSSLEMPSSALPCSTGVIRAFVAHCQFHTLRMEQLSLQRFRNPVLKSILMIFCRVTVAPGD